MNKLVILALVLSTFAAFPSVADAKNRPTVDSDTGLDCFLDPDADPDLGDGVIVSCCYDDGCWICEHNPGQNCVWDPKYRSMLPISTEPTIKPGDFPGGKIHKKTLPTFGPSRVSILN
jgi:hypothetical protein